MPPERLRDEALDLAERIAVNAPVSKDRKEGVTARLEGRAPQWQGR